MTAVLNQQVAPPTSWVGPRRSVPALGLAGVCAAAAFTELSAEEGQVYCPYRLVTGGWCPGCGCTRALKSLVRGDVAGSLAMNPWLVILFVQALTFSVGLLAKPTQTMGWVRRYKVHIGVFNIAVGVGLWAVRLATGVIPLPF